MPKAGPRRGATSVHYLVAGVVLLTGAGLTADWTSWPLLTTTLGPTAYVFLAHPDSETSRVRNAAIGHGAAVAAGLMSLAVLGLWTHPSIVTSRHVTLTQAAASGLAVGITLFVLEAADSHHAPAAATALLVATGTARPVRPLVGLVLGLAGVIAFGPVFGKLIHLTARRPAPPRPGRRGVLLDASTRPQAQHDEQRRQEAGRRP